MMIYICWILSLLGLYLYTRMREKNRIEEILNLVENLEKKNYKTPMKQDEFSILEDQIYKLFLEIVEKKEKFKDYSLAQIRNLEDISHQIKTPITNMLFDIEILEKEDIEFQKFKVQLNRLNSLVEILLKLSSLDAQNEKMKKDKIYVEEIFDYVLDILGNEIERKNIEIIEKYSNELITGDFYWISEAIINILKNSLNLSGVNKIKITTVDNPIFTTISIEDDGGGIKEEHKSKIFNRFYKTPDSNGFGLGLAISKTIIESNNGEIRVENSNEGANFIIKLYK
ncbi:Signal transduction histidine kinase [Peptoniphilus asaccharolyticus DSM 20463]|uniref:histidine kinase n=2 Tax=Peptoniphilus asaccharolyticus TaxID=1258 RepID=A0A1W1VDM3_PEPAS|nr:Signal transduction histidine kinase [Peptoniphilus asaccharolyticus DSM 20463]